MSRDASGETARFNEATLRAEIVKVWGEHGAHIDVYDALLRAAGVGGVVRSDGPHVISEGDSHSVLGAWAFVTHEAPHKPEGVTLCCGKTLFELPLDDRATTDRSRVTCKAGTVYERAMRMAGLVVDPSADTGRKDGAT